MMTHKAENTPIKGHRISPDNRNLDVFEDRVVWASTNSIVSRFASAVAQPRFCDLKELTRGSLLPIMTLERRANGTANVPRNAIRRNAVRRNAVNRKDAVRAELPRNRRSARLIRRMGEYARAALAALSVGSATGFREGTTRAAISSF